MGMTHYHILNRSMKADGAVPEKRFFKADGSLCGAGEQAAGVSVSAAAATGDVFGGCLLGLAIVATGGSVSVGDYVESDADGKAVVKDEGISMGLVMEVGTGECQVFLNSHGNTVVEVEPAP